jgi:hypothetical protein
MEQNKMPAFTFCMIVIYVSKDEIQMPTCIFFLHKNKRRNYLPRLK